MIKIKEGRTLPIILNRFPQAKAGAATPVGKVRPMLTVVRDESEGPDESATAAITGPIAGSASLIDEIVREGARRMLAEALQAEVAAYIERFAGELDEGGRRLVVRNGLRRPRGVPTRAGGGGVGAPRGQYPRARSDTRGRGPVSSAGLP